MPPVKVRRLPKMLHADGWIEVRPGPHRQFRHRHEPGTVTVSGAPGEELDRGTLRSVFRQAGLRWPPDAEHRKRSKDR